LLASTFNPDQAFAGDLESSEDELILTAAASARDDYVPAYSLAIAFRCVPIKNGCAKRYSARMLRADRDVDKQLGKGIELMRRLSEASSDEDRQAVFDDSGLQWLEADLQTCKDAYRAMETVRSADWRPDIRYEFLEVKDRDILMHPAQIWVRMSGTYSTTRYQGWVLGNGVPAAISKLLGTLEPCWKPSQSPPPWERPGGVPRISG
jgi:hypothetical protein